MIKGQKKSQRRHCCWVAFGSSIQEHKISVDNINESEMDATRRKLELIDPLEKVAEQEKSGIIEVV